MSARPLVDDRTLERLTEYAAGWTGFSPDAILPDAIRRAVLSLGGTPEELVVRAAVRDRAVVHALCQAVSVGETFFFRHPDQFRWVTSDFIPGLIASKRSAIRAWSAGCATGEEAYSMAACLLEAMPAGSAVEVLGTDLLERNVAFAREAAYGAWSCRPSGPQLHPVLHDDPSGKRRVDERVRSVTRFDLHNLLDVAPSGTFDLIFCRNVLVYFSPAAARAAVQHLIAALAPSGALLFGPMDLPEAPSGLSRCGAPELQPPASATANNNVPPRNTPGLPCT